MPGKRKTRQKRSFVLRDEDIDTDENNHVSNKRAEDINIEQNQDDSMESEQNGEEENVEVNRKRVRGPTFMVKVWGQPREKPKKKIKCNAKGQPIGPTKSTFVEFLGTIARNGSFAPIHITDWRYVSEQRKEDIIKIVKEKFEIPPGMDYWIKQYIGKRWRNWKTQLKARHFDEEAPLDSRVVESQWKKIVEYWKSDVGKRISQKNKEVRKEKKMHGRTGKKSFAQKYDEMEKDETSEQPISRMEMFKACFLDKNKNAPNSFVANALKEMEEKKKQLPAGSVDKIAPDDIFAQVIGKDRNGRVRMMGGGVAPSDLWDNIPSRGSSYRMAMEYKSALERTEERYNEQVEINKKMMADMAEFRAFINHHQTSDPSVNTLVVRRSSSVQKEAHASQQLKVNGYVGMKSCFDSSQVVAKGYLQSVDPTWEVGGHVLGNKFCSVSIQVAVDPSEELIRPFEPFVTVADAVGVSVAWPKNLVFNIIED